ncbi:hypothetical protein BH18ACT1_BH18ACT1_09560 [soil metagenome]
MRIVTRLVSTLLALALLVGGALAVLEITAAGLGRDDHLVLPWRDWRQTLLDTPWEDFAVRLVCAVLVALGLLLLFLLVAPRRPRAVALAPRVDGATADLDRSGLERWLAVRVSKADGVASSSVRVRGGKAKVQAVTPARETAAVEQAVTTTADAALAELGLGSSLPVRVSVISRRDG